MLPITGIVLPFEERSEKCIQSKLGYARCVGSASPLISTLVGNPHQCPHDDRPNDDHAYHHGDQVHVVQISVHQSASAWYQLIRERGLGRARETDLPKPLRPTTTPFVVLFKFSERNLKAWVVLRAGVLADPIKNRASASERPALPGVHCCANANGHDRQGARTSGVAQVEPVAVRDGTIAHVTFT